MAKPPKAAYPDVDSYLAQVDGARRAELAQLRTVIPAPKTQTA